MAAEPFESLGVGESGAAAGLVGSPGNGNCSAVDGLVESEGRGVQGGGVVCEVGWFLFWFWF